MDKAILHSVLETTAIEGTEVSIKFTQGFDQYSGRYRIDVNKVGRGRGGSRVIEATNLETGATLVSLPGTRNSGNTGERLLGTAVSEYIESITVGDAVYDEGNKPQNPSRRRAAPAADSTPATDATPATEPVKRTRTPRGPKSTTTKGNPGKRVASILGPMCQENPGIRLRLVTKTGDFTGEWRVESYVYENDKLVMELRGLNNDNTFTFDTDLHGAQLTDADLIEVE